MSTISFVLHWNSVFVDPHWFQCWSGFWIQGFVLLWLQEKLAFGPQKRTSSTSKHEISSLFLFLWVILAPPVSVFLLRNQNQCESGSTTTLHWRMRCGFCRWQKYIAMLQIYCIVYRPESREIAACRGASSGGYSQAGFAVVRPIFWEFWILTSYRMTQ